MLATCTNDGCANAAITIDVGDLTYVDLETGEERMMDVICGVCGGPVANLAEAPR